MTPFVKKKEIKNNWYLVDANNLIVGRLAAFISKVLRGKNKTTYNPHIDNGDYVIVTNVNKIKFSGNKFSDKKYYKHTGFPGGIKNFSPQDLEKKNKTDLEIAKILIQKAKIEKKVHNKKLEFSEFQDLKLEITNRNIKKN